VLNQFAVVWLAKWVISEIMSSGPFCRDAYSGSCCTISPRCSIEEVYNAGMTHTFILNAVAAAGLALCCIADPGAASIHITLRSLYITTQPYNTPINTILSPKMCALVAVAAAGLALRCIGASGAASIQTLKPKKYM